MWTGDAHTYWSDNPDSSAPSVRDALLDAEACIVAFARRLGHPESDVAALVAVRRALAATPGEKP
jgi:hypothetical protein